VYEWVDFDGQMTGSQQQFAEDQVILDRILTPVGLTSEVAYDCRSWPTIDTTVFTEPTDVLFRDLNQNAIMETGTIFTDPGGEF
jgi:hypothetical protein